MELSGVAPSLSEPMASLDLLAASAGDALVTVDAGLALVETGLVHLGRTTACSA